VLPVVGAPGAEDSRSRAELSSVVGVQLDVDVLKAAKVGDQLLGYFLNGGARDGRGTIHTERTL
jgi:hypothetical protein